MVDPNRMRRQLVLHEGIRQHFYVDTEGNTTWGVGFNVTARGLSELERMLERELDANGSASLAEVMNVLDLDITRVQHAVVAAFPAFSELSEVRQRVVVDLAFNIGFRALGFKRCRAAIERKDWSTAAVELHKAHWAKQVQASVDLTEDARAILENAARGRADRLARMLLTGEDYAQS